MLLDAALSTVAPERPMHGIHAIHRLRLGIRINIACASIRPNAETMENYYTGYIPAADR